MKQKIYLYVLSALPCIMLVFMCSNCQAQCSPPFKRGTDTAAISDLLKKALVVSGQDSAIQKLKAAARLSIEGDYFLGAAKSLCAAGARYNDIGKYEEALHYANEAMPYARKSGNKSQVAFCYNLYGVIALMQGDYVHASDEYFKALNELKNIEENNKGAMITIYTNLAVISARLGQPDKRIYYLNKGAYFARDSTMASSLLAGILINKGNYYLETNVDTAIVYYMEVLDIADRMAPAKMDKRIRFRALAEANLADAYLKKGAYERSVVYSRDAIALTKDKFKFITTAATYTLAEALMHLKKYEEAEELLVKVISENAAEHTKDHSIRGYVILSELYRETKQYKKALDCMDSLTALKDTLVTAEKVKAIKQVEAKYDMAEKDRQIIKNELLIAKQQNNINGKNMWIGSISAGLFLLIALSAGIYISNRQKQVSVIKSLKQENTISILKGVVQGEENERIRLARDLHDGIGGMLSATKMRFMALRHENSALISSPRYLEAMGLLDIMGDEIRKTSHNLMPEVLLKQNLADALQGYCNNMQAGSKLNIDFQSFGSFEDLSNDVKLNVYRIVQELLKNTIQHAKATMVIVQLVMLEEYLTINVEDNGVGFDTNKMKEGLGLNNLKTRVLSQEGHYTLKSEPGKGTMVFIEFANKLVAGNFHNYQS